MLSIVASVAVPLFLILILISDRFKNFSHLSKQGTLTLFGIKVLAGLAMWAIYSFYYSQRGTSDAFRFFDDAIIMHSSINVDPGFYFRMLFGIDDTGLQIQSYYDSMSSWVKPIEDNVYNDNRIVIRMNAFILLFSGGSYFVHVLLFCFISFIGQLYLFRSLNIAFPNSSLGNLVSAFLLPSVLFWSSGILKEPLLMLAFGFIVFYIFHFNIKERKRTIRNTIAALLSIILLSYLKFYILILLVPALLSYFFIRKRNSKAGLWIGLSFLSLYLLVVCISYFPGGVNIFEIVARKQHDFIKVAEVWQAGSAIAIPKLSDSPLSLVIHSPVAFFNTLLRPFPWEGKNIFMLIAAVENLLFIFLIFLAGRNIKSMSLNNKYSGFMVTFVLGLFILIGLVTPIVGAMVRYKIPALPFLTAVLFMTIPDKIIKGKLADAKIILNRYFFSMIS